MWLTTTGREFDEEVIEQLAVTPKFVGKYCLHTARYCLQHRKLGPPGSCLARQHQRCDQLRRLYQFSGRAIPSATITAGGLPSTRVLSLPGLPTTRVL
jgi:hypothetical protein